MKIAFVCTEKLPVPPISGGAVQIYIEGILPELSKHHEITVFSIKRESLKDEEEINGVKYIRVAGNNKTEYIKNIKLKLDDSFDLIHVFNRPRWIVSLSKDLPNTKFSLSLHNEMFHEEKIPNDMGLECINRVEFITTVSKFIADGVRQRFPEADKKLHPVYSGVDINKFKSVFSKEGIQNKTVLKKELGIGDKKVVLFVGRLGEKKGAEKLIYAMKNIMDLRSDVALVIIGSKWYGENTSDDYTKSVVALSKSLKGPVIFTGFLPQTLIPSYFNIGDIFVCPSQWREPLARVHYEAMAAGLPIITTNRGGNKEVIEGYGNGIVIDDFSNPDAFSEQISALLDDPDRASALGQKGRSLAEEKYNWNRVANDLLALINNVGSSMQTSPEKTTEIKQEPNAAVEPDAIIKKDTVKSAEKTIEIKQEPKVALKPDAIIKKDTVKSAEKTTEIKQEPKVAVKPDAIIKKDTVKSTEKTAEINQEPKVAVKPDVPNVMIKKDTIKSVEKTAEKQTDIPAKENKASKQVLSKKSDEIKQEPIITEKNQDEFTIMLRKIYPGIPTDVAEYLEKFKDNYKKGDL